MNMGFGYRWIKWIEATTFRSIMSVMVNGSTTVIPRWKAACAKVTRCHHFCSFWS